MITLQYGRDTATSNLSVTPRPSCWQIFCYMKSIALSNGGETWVDDEDYEKYKGYKWHRGATGYAMCFELGKGHGKRKMLRLHRLVMNAPDGVFVDHRNTDRLDNRKSNLRFADHHTNGYNRRKQRPTSTSQFKGVYQRRDTGRFEVAIMSRYVGTFDDEHIAGLAYDFWATFLFGDYALTNFPVVAHHTASLPKQIGG